MNEEEIFHQALARSPEERPAFLEQACAADPSLRTAVEALLRANVGATGFLEHPSPAPVATVDEPLRETVGNVIGPYKLIEQIGEGGMGTVWMAQQTEPVKRLVAVKLIKAGMDSRQVIARFEAERQALALMDHPNIARVLDGGTTSAGRPYFVMDLVKGVPITRYCDEHHLTPQQRLELFIPVCQAIQHAHHKGIIHRDLKPSNVLVAPYDGKAVVKVIDFGVAKATGQQLTDRTLVTGFGVVVGTLEYMSPEQAELNNHDIDTRSDIYALGVLLYELLAGSPPFSRKELEMAGMVEMLRVIREQEPSKPSTKLSTAEGLPTLAANRGTEPAKLTKLLRGELDWIVMKALEKDRNRRYETANGFAMDVQRYLADELVLACPASAAYRLCKFARRHKGRLAVAALVLFFLVLLGSGVGWVVQDQSAREAESARQQGERQAKVAGEVESILAEVDRLEKEQKWPEALEAARRAEAAVAGGEADPVTAERVHQRLKDLEFIDRLERIRMERSARLEGKFTLAGADHDYARACREYGVDIDEFPVEMSIDRLKVRPALTIALAAALDDWVLTRRLISEADVARWKRLVAVARGIDPEPLRDRLRAAWGQPIANVRDDLRRLAESIDVRAQHPATLFILVRTLANAALPDSAMRILRAAQNLHPEDFWLNFQLSFYLKLGNDHEGAVRFATAVAAIRPHSALAHKLLGAALIGQKKFDEAIAACRKAIELDPKDAITHSDLGRALHLKGLVDEAIAEHRKSLELLPKNADANNHAQDHNNLGYALAAKGRVDEAILEYKKSIEFDPKLAPAHSNLGNSLRDKGLVDEAIAEYQKAIELDPKYAAPHTRLGNALLEDKGLVDEAIAEHKKAIELDPKWATAHGDLGGALARKGLVDEAIAELRKAIELDPKYARAHNNLGIWLRDEGRVDEAIAAYKKAIELDPKFAAPHTCLGNALLEDKGRVDEAIDENRKAIELDPKLAAAHLNLGNCLVAKGRLDEAIDLYKKANELDPKSALGHYNLGNILYRQKKLDEAVAEFRKAIKLDPRISAAYKGLGNVLRDQGKPGEAIVRAHIGLGIVLRDQGKLDEAVAEFRKAIEINPKNAIPHNNLCGALRDQKKLDEAVAEGRKAIELDPKYANAHDNLGNALFDQGKLDEAVAEFRKAIELDPKNAPFHLHFGNALYAQKKWEEAVAEYRKVIEIDPRLAFAHDNLGLALRNQGKVDEAVAEWKKAIELDPRYPNPHYNLARALWDKGLVDEAIAERKKVIELDPTNPGAHYDLGNALKGKGDLDGAERAYREAVRLDGDHHRPAIDALAQLLLSRGKFKEAIATYQKVVILDPKDASAHTSLAWLLTTCRKVKLRDAPGGLEAARKAVGLAPQSDSAWHVLGWAHYRAGDWKASIAALEKSCALQDNPKGGDAYQWFCLAMAHWQLGEKDRARQLYDRAVKWMAKNQPRNEELGRFRAEAALLLELKEKK
jgi:tetratricopeptide (TPR) repeat protein